MDALTIQKWPGMALRRLLPNAVPTLFAKQPTTSCSHSSSVSDVQCDGEDVNKEVICISGNGII